MKLLGGLGLVLLTGLIGAGAFRLLAPDAFAKTTGIGVSGKKRAAAAAARVKPRLERDLARANLKWGAPVFLRAFKDEKILELWIKETGKKTFKLFRTYPIAAASGKLGPKEREGDRQVPEGFYHVPPGMMNPQSRYHLAFNIGYPNQYDRKRGRTGSFIMIHGSNVSIGCLAMTDQKIEEIYSLCDAAHKKGQNFFRVHLFPFRLTDDRLSAQKGTKWYPFWQNLAEGYSWFETKKIPPNVTFSSTKYTFKE